MAARWYEHWREEVFPLLPTGRPRRFLEIGIGMGDTARFIGKHGKETSDDTYVGIDPWEAETHRQRSDVTATIEEVGRNEERARWQIKRAWGSNATVFNNRSHVVLPLLSRQCPFDLILVDGLHTTEGVLQDSRLAWPLLADGGIMIWDDWGKMKRDHKAVKAAVAMFTEEVEGQYKELFRTRQYGAQKCQ